VEGKTETRAVSLGTHGFFSRVVEKAIESLRFGMTQMIALGLDSTLSEPARKLQC
jgi:hypothetical protein